MINDIDSGYQDTLSNASFFSYSQRQWLLLVVCS